MSELTTSPADASPPDMKRCTKCNEAKPVDEFHRSKRTKDGRHFQCKPCRNESGRQLYAATRDQQLERERRYREANRERIREHNRQYREENREAVRARGREWVASNLAQVLEYQRDYTEELKAAALAHYGTACACCGSTENLTVDHINGDGREHREELFGNNKAAGRPFYRWLAENDYPDGYQTLCNRCNTSKGRGESCRIAHEADDRRAR